MVKIHGTSQDDILDSFLTTLESKLRGPFSSLDLAKAVSTTALRGSAHIGGNPGPNNDDPAREYLNNLSSVFRRTNKVIQCRMLIGLLGLNDMRTNRSSGSDRMEAESNIQYLTPEIIRILHETQESGLHEDWVRTTSGLIEGVMFRTKDASVNGNTRESCRSQEATKIIEDTGTEVCEKVEAQIKKVGQPYTAAEDSKPQKPVTAVPTNAVTANKRNRGFTIEKVIPSSSQPPKEPKIPSSKGTDDQKVSAIEPTPPDLNACFAPYRYSLISTPILNVIIPEFNYSQDTTQTKNSNGVSDKNCHFQVNSSADILQIDLQLEAQRAKEHGSVVAANSNKTRAVGNSNKGSGNLSKSSLAGKSAFPPGFRPAKLVPTKSSATSGKLGAMKAATSGKSSLFMPKKKPAANLFNTTTKFRPQATKALLRRKGGGAQALMKSSATSSGGGAILNKLGGGSTAGSGTTGRTGRFNTSRDNTRGRVSRMKMIDDDDVDTLNKLQRSTAASNMSAAELRASKRKRIMEKFGNKKPKLSTSVSRPGGTQPMEKAPSAPQHKQVVTSQAPQQQTMESWQSLLRDRSNKLSEEDRIRVERFFRTTNPTERSALLSSTNGGSIHKMKIHEQRGTDPATGKEIKETFYLELDYSTGNSKQSKKVKRY